MRLFQYSVLYKVHKFGNCNEVDNVICESRARPQENHLPASARPPTNATDCGLFIPSIHPSIHPSRCALCCCPFPSDSPPPPPPPSFTRSLPNWVKRSIVVSSKDGRSEVKWPTNEHCQSPFLGGFVQWFHSIYQLKASERPEQHSSEWDGEEEERARRRRRRQRRSDGGGLVARIVLRSRVRSVETVRPTVRARQTKEGRKEGRSSPLSLLSVMI